MTGKGTNAKKNFIWNMLGSGIYAVASMVLSFLTIRMVGGEKGGMFAIALTISQMFIYIAYFEMRTYQVTDAKKEFEFRDYYTTKIITCVAMMVVSIVYICMRQYDFQKSLVIIGICFYRVIDGFADVFESQFQTDGRLDLAGKSLAYRTVLSVVAYFIVLYLSKSLELAVLTSIAAAVIGLIIFDIVAYSKIGQITMNWNMKKIKSILLSCMPLFIGVFLWTYILSASRLAVDKCMSSEYQAVYQVLFMPVSVINLFAGFLVRPILMTLTEYFKEFNFKEFYKIIFKTIAVIIGFTLVCLIGAYIIGIPVLSLIVNLDLAEYKEVLLLLLFSGGVNAIAFLLYYVLSIYRDFRNVMIGYGFASILAFLISPLFVQKWGLNGGAISYFVVVLFLTLYFSTAIIYETFKIKERQKRGE